MKSNHFLPRIEGLESRWCPAAHSGVTAVLSGTSLRSVGDKADNIVQITDDGAGNLKVTMDGGAEQSFSGVTQIKAFLGDGNDTFDYKLEGTTTTNPDGTTTTTGLTQALGFNLHLGRG